MPIYEFECRGCGNRFEKLCSISAGADGVECPGCRGADTRKLISGFFSRVSGGTGGGSSCNCGGCSKSSCSGCGH